MSATPEIDAVRTRTGPDATRVFDVSGLDPAVVTEYADEAGECYFERKGGRTFLVAR